MDLNTSNTTNKCTACKQYGLCDNTLRSLAVCEATEFTITTDSNDDILYEENRSCSGCGSCGHVHTICRADVYDAIFEENKACSGFGACGHVNEVYILPLEVLHIMYDTIYEDNKACTGFGACGNMHIIYSTTNTEDVTTVYDSLYEDRKVCSGFGACGNIHTIYTTYTEVMNNGIDTEIAKLARDVFELRNTASVVSYFTNEYKNKYDIEHATSNRVTIGQDSHVMLNDYERLTEYLN
eukprot:2252-Heterococcus_DN1.PRE.1